MALRNECFEDFKWMRSLVETAAYLRNVTFVIKLFRSKNFYLYIFLRLRTNRIDERRFCLSASSVPLISVDIGINFVHLPPKVFLSLRRRFSRLLTCTIAHSKEISP